MMFNSSSTAASDKVSNDLPSEIANSFLGPDKSDKVKQTPIRKNKIGRENNKNVNKVIEYERENNTTNKEDNKNLKKINDDERENNNIMKNGINKKNVVL